MKHRRRTVASALALVALVQLAAAVPVAASAAGKEGKLASLAMRKLGKDYGCVVAHGDDLVLSVTRGRALARAWRVVRKAGAQDITTLAVVAPHFGYQRLRQIQRRLRATLSLPNYRTLVGTSLGPRARTCQIVVWVYGDGDQVRQRAEDARRRFGADRVRLARPEPGRPAPV